MTLGTDWAAKLPWAGDYEDHCRERENACARKASHGGYRTNSSCERLFGVSAPVGQLESPGGSPRWKQRALYDAMKDAACVWGDVSLARLSTHDVIGRAPLGTILDGKAPVDVDALRSVVEARTTAAEPSPRPPTKETVNSLSKPSRGPTRQCIEYSVY